MNLKKFGRVITSTFFSTGPSSYKKRFYRAAVSQSLRNTAVNGNLEKVGCRLFMKHPPRRLNFIAHIFGEAVFSVYSAKAEMCEGVSTWDYLWKS